MEGLFSGKNKRYRKSCVMCMKLCSPVCVCVCVFERDRERDKETGENFFKKEDCACSQQSTFFHNRNENLVLIRC